MKNLTNVKTKISTSETLLGFNIGEPTIIKNKTIPYLKVKRGVDYLRLKDMILRYKQRDALMT